jgi:hypothetical protein
VFRPSPEASITPVFTPTGGLRVAPPGSSLTEASRRIARERRGNGVLLTPRPPLGAERDALVQEHARLRDVRRRRLSPGQPLAPGQAHDKGWLGSGPHANPVAIASGSTTAAPVTPSVPRSEPQGTAPVEPPAMQPVAPPVPVAPAPLATAAVAGDAGAAPFARAVQRPAPPAASLRIAPTRAAAAPAPASSRTGIAPARPSVAPPGAPATSGGIDVY